jgi:tRNA-binding EMAP/Myf-like protein
MPLIVGLVTLVEEVNNSQNLKKCLIQVSNDTDHEKLTIVTNAKNVKQGMRVVVASVGTVLPDEGNSVESKVIGGVRSNGMLCDAKMCGWSSTNPGLAVSLPDSFELGQEAPSQNPRMMATTTAEPDGELSIKQKKELEKAARKAALKEKRAEKAAAKKDA